MGNQGSQVRVLAVASAEMCALLARQLTPLDVELVCALNAAEVAHLVQAGEIFEVAILPVALPPVEWWALWGELCLLSPRPSILVYARSATFQLWAGVLESGACDLIAEPFSDQEIQDAVARAVWSFRNNENLPRQKPES